MNIKPARIQTKALTALLSALILALSQFAPAYAAAETASLTRAEARDTILAAASHYRDGLKPADIMFGYGDGSLKETQAVTRLEALVMLSRAFGELPESGNDWARSSVEIITDPESGEEYASEAAIFDDVPGWASRAYDNLWAGHIIVTDGGNLLKGGEAITAAELGTYLKRVYALYGTRLQDDFYAAVNREWLDKTELRGGEYTAGIFKSLTDISDARIEEIIEEIVSGKWEKGTPERKIADYYNAYIDSDAQKKTGAAPLKPYLGKLAAAKTMTDLETAYAEFVSGTAYLPFLSFNFMEDYMDSTKTAVYISANLPMVMMANYGEATQTAYAAKMFELAGYPNAKAAAASAIKIETALMTARANAASTNSVNIEDRFIRYTAEDLQKIFPGVNMKTILTSGGLKESPVYVTTAEETGVLKEFAKFFTAENVPALGAYAAYRLLDEYRLKLGPDFENAYDYAMGEVARTYTEEETSYYARFHISDKFSGYISEVYAKKYFSAESKAAVESMIHTFIENYKGRIENLEWLGSETKKKAIKKLDTMVIKVGWSDKHDAFIDKLEVVGVSEGGSLAGNLIAIEKLKLADNAAAQGKTADRTVWRKPAYEVNASYNATLNDITFPAAILQAPFYDINAAPEVNLSGIGWVIAHEITHAFDKDGSQFDENGNLADWWTPEDKAKFNKLCEAVAAHYDGAEIAPGIVTDGKQTLGENTADLGGISCALEALRAVKDKPDYKLFFTNYAVMQRKTADNRDGYREFANDVHSNARVRANQLVQNFGEFYDAFGIKPGDGMYIAPEKRVKIW